MNGHEVIAIAIGTFILGFHCSQPADMSGVSVRVYCANGHLWISRIRYDARVPHAPYCGECLQRYVGWCELSKEYVNL